jgi:drug/metabolite transporter (DMT)-like permease
MKHPSEASPVVGITLKIISTLVFSIMATLIKLVSDRYPTGELTFFRSFFALVPVLAWVSFRGEFPSVFRTRNIWGHAYRSAIGVTAMYCGFAALGHLPIADATAIGYGAPLLTVILAVVMLGEKVHLFRWTAVVVGLAGVLVILSDYFGEAVKPGGSAEIGAIFAIAGTFATALAMTQVRYLTRFEGAATIVVYFSALSALFSLFTLPLGWVVPDLTDLAILISAGIFGGIGQVLLTQSYRFGDASVIAPFEYTSMLWALVVSQFVFGTWPSATVTIGSTIVIAAGLAVIFRESRLGIERTRSKRAQTPPPPIG